MYVAGAAADAARITIVADMLNMLSDADEERDRAWELVQEAALSEGDLLSRLKSQALEGQDSHIPGIRADDPRDCLVCGWQFYGLGQPWGPTGESPTGSTCPCCGAIFGEDDVEIGTIKQYRSAWLSDGAPWHDPATQLASWGIHELAVQMRNLPVRVR